MQANVGVAVRESFKRLSKIGSFRNIKSSRAARIRAGAILALLFCSQSAWSQISISPSPSYNGSYTVSFAGHPLGCYVQYDPYGFEIDYCNTLQEYVNNNITGEWQTPTGSTSKSFSGKAENTYTYYILYTWSYMGQSGYSTYGPTSEVVDLPDPVINLSASPVGPANDPSYYILTWTTLHATSCNLGLTWARRYNLPYGPIGYGNLPANYSWEVDKSFYDTTNVSAKVTCDGSGGENFAVINLPFGG